MRDKIIKCSKAFAKNLAIAGGLTFAVATAFAVVVLAAVFGRSLLGDVGQIGGGLIGFVLCWAACMTAVSCWKE